MQLPARLLVPIALAFAVLSLVVVIASSSSRAEAVMPLPASALSTGVAPTPTAPTAPAVPASASTYVVEAGDTPSAIAAEAQVDLDALLQLNAIDDASAVRVGQRLQLPR